MRVRHPANFSRSEIKVNLIIAVEPGNVILPPDVLGNITRPWRWVHISQYKVDQLIFWDFINEVLSDIETNPVPGGYDGERCLLWDHISSHKLAYVMTQIRDRLSLNHFISVDRLLYCPNVVPIENMFYEVAPDLAKLYNCDWDIYELRHNIYNIYINIGNDGKLRNTFY